MLPQQSAAVKVVGASLGVMLSLKLLFPSLVVHLQSFWKSLVLSHSQNTLILIGFLVFALTYWCIGLLFLLGPDLNHVPAVVWDKKVC
jgi:hypothetical protein